MIILIRLNGKPFNLQSLHNLAGFPGSSDDKESACNVGDPGSILGWEDPLEKEMATTPVCLPGESHGGRSLVGYRPPGR